MLELGRIIDQMEARGIISGYEGSKPRKVLISKEKLQELKMSNALEEKEKQTIENEKKNINNFNIINNDENKKEINNIIETEDKDEDENEN